MNSTVVATEKTRIIHVIPVTALPRSVREVIVRGLLQLHQQSYSLGHSLSTSQCCGSTRRDKPRITMLAYEMEGNPCFEASDYVKQTIDTQKQEIHVYERVKQNNQVDLAHDLAGMLKLGS